MRNHGGSDIAVLGIDHLVLCGQVYPQLQTQHARRGQRHFLVQNAAASGHPLAIAIAYNTLVAKTVLVLNGPLHKIGEGFNATVRMRGKALGVVIGILRIKGIKHKKGVKSLDRGRTQHAHKAHASAVNCRLAGNVLNDGS